MPANYCTEHYKSLVRMLFAAEDMRHTSKSQAEQYACKKAAASIQAKLKEHLQFCQGTLDSRAELVLTDGTLTRSSSPPSGSTPEVPFS